MSIQPNNFKNIIFDLGGVLLNIDYNLTSEAFGKLGIKDFYQQFSKAQQKPLFDSYEKGLVSSVDFLTELNNSLSHPVHLSLIQAAWNALLLDLPTERLDLLKKMKKSHRTFLLSNTNEIHIVQFFQNLKQQFGIPNLDAYFEKVYLSYEMRMRKPDKEIFQFVLEQQQLNPAETLFIDDSPQHIETAKKLGIHTYWLDVQKETITGLFAGY